jgi:hypothetical protein
MKLSTADLENLARLFGATIHQIQNPPDAANLVRRLDRTQEIIVGLNETDLERWLAIGESLLQK